MGRLAPPSMQTPAAADFSLDRLERLAYGRQHEAALRELVALLECMRVGYGAAGDLGTGAVGDPLAAQRDRRIVTRIAAAASALLADPHCRISDAGLQRAGAWQLWLAVLFGASPFGNADHVMRALEPADGPLPSAGTDLAKFCLLYGPDSQVPLDLEALWARDRHLALALGLSLLANRHQLSPQAHQLREKLLGWLPERLAQADPGRLPEQLLHDVWMNCSYAFSPRKHDIKEALNGVARRKLLAAGIGDVTAAPGPRRERPVVLCVLEWFHSRHAMFRCYSRSLAALRERCKLVAVAFTGAIDDPARALFDEVHMADQGPSVPAFQGVRQVRAVADTVRPDLLYYPSVGMFAQTVYLANLRLAPVQVASIGHPATTRSAFIDHVIAEEDVAGDPACFSERLVLLPPRSMPFTAFEPSLPPARRERGAVSPVRIAVTATPMKLNAVFLGALQRIARTARTPVQFHVFCATASGMARLHLDNLLQQALPGLAVTHPQQDYEAYLEALDRCDLFLNPFPFGNTNGLVDTVRQGLPGVCLTGPQVHSRIDEALFRRLGLPPSLVAGTVDEYVAAAVDLVDRHELRLAIARDLRAADPDAILFEGAPERFAEALLRLCRAR